MTRYLARAAAALTGLSRLSMNQATVSKLNLTQTLRLCVEQEIPAVGLWRHRVAELGVSAVRGRSAPVRAARLQPVPRGLLHPRRARRATRRGGRQPGRCRGGGGAEEADTLMLVSGGLVPGTRDLGLARRMIADAIAELVPARAKLGVRLGIEALPPDVLRRPGVS